MRPQGVVSKILLTFMNWPDQRHWIFIFLILNFFADFSRAQRLFVPPNPQPTSVSESEAPPIAPQHQPETFVLKTYPDGTKKIVPLEALNFRDDGTAFGGPPKLSLIQNPPTDSPSSPEKLNLASIGTASGPATVTASIPPSADPLAGATQVAAADPMGGGAGADPMGGGGGNPMGGAPAGDPMGGGGAAAAPADPLGGSGSKTAPPLQTVSGKPAPIVGDTTMLQLGEWESFFLNAGIGGSIQGQLTARRVYNGNNRQAYPVPVVTGPLAGQQLSAESFTFQPGFRLDIEFGYNFYEWLGVGLQTGLTYNGLYQYNQELEGGGSLHNSADGELVQVPVQLNGILRWPGQVKFRPFVAGGIGAIWQQLDINNYYFIDEDVQGNYCRSAFQFGWNAQLGLTYTVEPGLDFYGAFKMMSAFMPVIGNYQFENSYNFALEVGIQSRF